MVAEEYRRNNRAKGSSVQGGRPVRVTLRGESLTKRIYEPGWWNSNQKRHGDAPRTIRVSNPGHAYLPTKGGPTEVIFGQAVMLP
jgi:hypothetical protein